MIFCIADLPLCQHFFNVYGNSTVWRLRSRGNSCIFSVSTVGDAVIVKGKGESIMDGCVLAIDQHSQSKAL